MSKVAESPTNSARIVFFFLLTAFGDIVCKRAFIMVKENPTRQNVFTNTIGNFHLSARPTEVAVGSPEMGIFLGRVVDLFMLPLGTRHFFGRKRTNLIKDLKHNSKRSRGHCRVVPPSLVGRVEHDRYVRERRKEFRSVDRYGSHSPL